MTMKTDNQTKRIAIRIIILVTALMMIAATTFADVSVPDVTGIPDADAVQALLDAGLSAGTVTRQYSSTLPEGHVISQDPTASSLVADNTHVNLVAAILPMLQINGPDHIVTQHSFYAVSAYATPTESGILHSDVSSDRYIGQTFSLIVEQDGTLSSEIPLESGDNILTLTVVYPSGLTISQEIIVTYELSAIPDIRIVSPAYGTDVSTQTVTVSGTVQSSLPADQIRLLFNNQVYFPKGTNGHYSFEIPNVILAQGSNTLPLVAETKYGAVSTVSLVYYQAKENVPVDAEEPPTIEIYRPLPGSFLTGTTIQVSGVAKGKKSIQSVLINGQDAVITGSGETVSFKTDLIFDGGDSKTISITATDSNGITGSLAFDVNYDAENPIITLTSPELQTTQSVYTVKSTPFVFSGTVEERHLAGLTLNNTAITVVPMSDNTWAFDVPVSLTANTEKLISLEARDVAGNTTGLDVHVMFESNLEINILSPAENSDVQVSSLDSDLTVTASIIGLTGQEKVYAILDSASAIPLTPAGETVSYNLSLPIDNAAHRLVLKVTDNSDALIEERSVSFRTKNMDNIPLEVSRQRPENNSAGANTNDCITFFFNKTIDPALLTIEVFETVHGKTYPLEKTGANLTTLSQVDLVDVNRDHEPVAGGISYFPENTMAAFYPEREFTYGSTIHVTLTYDGEERYRSEFKIRNLPTLVEGFVLDQFMEPLRGINVTLPDLHRSTLTDFEGHYSFGFGEDASEHIPGGRYKILVNSGFQKSGYGLIDDMVILDEGRLNNVKVLKLSALNKKEPFRQIGSGMNQVSLSNGDLVLDFSQAELQFPDGSTQGPVHTQFMNMDMLNHRTHGLATPYWVYGIQPMGITVTGPVGIKLNIPMYSNSYDYLEGQTYVILVGLDPVSYEISPIGIGHVNKEEHKVTHEGPVNLKRLDYIGYAMYPQEIQSELQRVVEGQITLGQLLNNLESNL